MVTLEAVGTISRQPEREPVGRKLEAGVIHLTADEPICCEIPKANLAPKEIPDLCQVGAVVTTRECG